MNTGGLEKRGTVPLYSALPVFMGSGLSLREALE